MDAPPEPASAEREPAGAGRSAPRLLRVVCLLGLLAAAAGLAAVAARSIAVGYPDFEYFYKAGACLLTRGGLDPGYDVSADGRVLPRGSLQWYLPVVPRLMTLLAWLPPRAAGGVWLALNMLALLATVRLVGRHLSGLPAQDWPVTQLLPLLALALFWYWEFKLNQVNNFTLLLVVGGYVCWQRRHPAAAGLWLGLAALLKLTPVVLLLWFALKRQWRVVAAALLTIGLAGPVGDALVFGVVDAADRYRGWFDRAVVRGSHGGLILSQVEMDWRNQSVGAVASRWLHPTNYATHFDNEPRMPAATELRTMNVACWSRSAVARLVAAIHALSLLGLVWLVRRPAAGLSSWELRMEWALLLPAMLWFMPVLRGYHLIWVYPTLAILAGALHRYRQRRGWCILAWACLALVVLAEIAGAKFDLTSPRAVLPHAGGILLAIVVLLALPIVVVLARARRAPVALT